MIYAGIGSRKTPPNILAMMRLLGGAFALAGYHLRSGGAQGADTAFQEGCDRWHGSRMIFRPEHAAGDLQALKLAERHHENWAALTPYAKLLMARNGYQILGRNLNRPIDFCVCWTEGGKLVGGTRQAIKIARENEIKVYNLAINADYEIMLSFLEPWLSIP